MTTKGNGNSNSEYQTGIAGYLHVAMRAQRGLANASIG